MRHSLPACAGSYPFRFSGVGNYLFAERLPEMSERTIAVRRLSLEAPWQCEQGETADTVAAVQPEETYNGGRHPRQARVFILQPTCTACVRASGLGERRGLRHSPRPSASAPLTRYRDGL
jgi:hypothetical protein